MRSLCRVWSSPRKIVSLPCSMSFSRAPAMWNETRDSVSCSTALRAIAGLYLRMGECMFILKEIANRTAHCTRSYVRCWRISNNSRRSNSLRFMTSLVIRARPQLGSTPHRPVLIRPLHPVQHLFPPRQLLHLSGEHRRPCGPPDRFSLALRQRSMDRPAASLLCQVGYKFKKSGCYDLSVDSYGYSCRCYCCGRAFGHRSALDLSLRDSRLAVRATTHLLSDQTSARTRWVDDDAGRGTVAGL